VPQFFYEQFPLLGAEMQFLIASTFQDSLAKLQSGEQQATKIAAVELQMNPGNPGLQMHRLDRARDRNFWSARVNDDLRLILHRTDASLLLCYVAHHDSAYAWAEHRKLTVHPATGAAQMVVVKETIQEIVIPQYVEQPVSRIPQPLPMLAAASDTELLSYGIPVDWLSTVRSADEDTVLEIVEQLPEEAREAVLSLATGIRPSPAPVVEAKSTVAALAGQEAIAFAHPDAQRRFRVVADLEELKAALEAPWEKWAIFLHPAQRAIVERDFSGPARVTGSAGTGKTIVALHRAVHLAEANPSSRVLLTTFNDVLVRALENKLRLLITNRPRLAEQIEVLSFESVARRLYESNLVSFYGPVKMATRATIEGLIREAMKVTPSNTLSQRFLMAEWDQVIDAAQLRTWDQYRDHSRVGRRSRLRETQRQAIWNVFESVLKTLEDRREMTAAEMFTRLAKHYQEGGAPPFDFAVIDEAQDVGQAELRCLAALGGTRRNSIFFAGDTAQRIFQSPFSWKANGVEDAWPFYEPQGELSHFPGDSGAR
jgi:mRNA-degrading endonuclease RelE of RelBE toxin-antitoxin system